jgi:hypothetical protein
MIIEWELKNIGKVIERRITGLIDRRRGRDVMVADDYQDRRSGRKDRRKHKFADKTSG